jgi:hypothetical protein
MSELSSKTKVDVGSVTKVAAWIVAAVLAYGALSTRIAVLESNYSRIVQDIAEIKADVKALLRKP